MKVFLRAGSAIIVTLAALLLTPALSSPPGSVEAHRQDHGGAFPHTAGTAQVVKWSQNGGYRQEIISGLGSWHATPTQIYTGVGYEATLEFTKADFYVQNRVEGWWGLAVNHPCTNLPHAGCVYQWADLYMNSRTLGIESSFIRQKVAAHEFGHGLGLSHPNTAGFNAVMRQGSLGYNTPQQHDIDDINGIYP